MAIEHTRRRFTVDEYHRMGNAGILHEDDRIELVDGEIRRMSPINVPPAACVGLLTMLLAPRLAGIGMVWVQNPAYIDDINEPQPDLAVLKPGDYSARRQHPGAEDILLFIEVADATVRTDRLEKIPRYARAGVPEVWLVNIPKGVVEVYSDPVGGKYKSISRVGRGGFITPGALPGITISAGDFLGAAK